MTPGQQAAITAAARDRAAANVTYVPGGMTKAGADCSGAVSGIYAQAGIDIGHMFSFSFPKSSKFVAVTGAPQVGDVGWYPGHVVIYDDGAGPGRNVWSASHTGGPVFGAGASAWYGKPTWYRYVGK